MCLLYTDGSAAGSVRQSQVQMFLLSDIYAGVVYYEQNDHQNKEPRSDFFWFHMTDGENISPVARFNVTIIVRLIYWSLRPLILKIFFVL